jgi:hypothetical protein
VGRLDAAGRDLGGVAFVNAIDEGAVPGGLRVEVVTEAAVDERIDDVGEPDEDVESEALTEQG